MNELLMEYFQAGGGASLRIDREGGVLYGVKILGCQSRNGRLYPTDTLRDALPLYENAKVNLDHPTGPPDMPRSYQDRFGVVRNVMIREDEGLFADFHFNPHHPLAEQLLWDAEHAPENVGFSHNVEASLERHEGKVVVKRIVNVRSVDLVADPATTAGLFESAEPDSETNTTVVVETDELATLRERLAACESRLDRLVQESVVRPISREQGGFGGGIVAATRIDTPTFIRLISY